MIAVIPRALVLTFMRMTSPIYTAIFDLSSELQSCIPNRTLDIPTWIFYKIVIFNLFQDDFIGLYLPTPHSFLLYQPGCFHFKEQKPQLNWLFKQ